MEKLFYILKYRLPGLYGAVESVARIITVTLFGRKIHRALENACIEGRVHGRPAVMRPLRPGDSDGFSNMLESLSSYYLKYFRPHELDLESIRRVIAQKDILTYGLFVNGKMTAYALLKLFPTRRAYIGRLVVPELSGSGVGAYLSRFLYFQAALLGFSPCSTIHRDNMASLCSHAAVRPYVVTGEMGGGYQRISFVLTTEDRVPPRLEIGKSSQSS